MLMNFNNRLIGLLSGAIIEKYLSHVISIKQQEQKNFLIIKFGAILLSIDTKDVQIYILLNILKIKKTSSWI